MDHPLDPVLWRYLCAVQRSSRVGVESWSREPMAICSRTMYRWQRRLGDQLLIVPSIAAERLGLVHAHVFVTGPSDEWLRLPYAVEACWLSPNLCRDTLYVHCLVPTEHQTAVQSLADTLPCDGCDLVWSGSGWQQLLQAEVPIDLPLPETGVADHALLQRHPLLIPVIMESFRYPNSLPLVWHRARTTITNVRAYMRRARIHYTNGSTHVTTMHRVLRTEQLLRQQVVRYHPLLAASIEVVLDIRIGRADLLTLLEDLRCSLHAIETYPTHDGFLCRLLGPHSLVDAMLQLPEQVRSRVRRLLFHTKRHPSPAVRFAYERLFNPRSGCWEVPA